VSGFKIERELEAPQDHDGQVDVELTFTMDKAVFRVVAKIAFGYFAWRFGADAALGASFDKIRRFIRYGEGERSQFAIVDQRPMLLGDEVTRRQSDSHLVGLSSVPRQPESTRLFVSPAGWKVELVALVSLYNVFTYRVRLTDDYAGIVPLRVGHQFNWRDRSVSELIVGSLVTPAR